MIYSCKAQNGVGDGGITRQVRKGGEGRGKGRGEAVDLRREPLAPT